ncbi:sugar porter family MFS transporter [Dawidia soli]|uniref:Sugar porter family MFS transporter n=1 Tax=Dawidia soli TaxID=2782352 RepID=A0AAP2D5Q7_9BACT|nr:sugar porter family MFS transporter [Dawidia soli]MBT1685873.1 sugar porter family MFS transporter [Dawidia soli]
MEVNAKAAEIEKAGLVNESPQANMRFVVTVSLVAAFGGLLFGYDTAVIAGAIGYLQTKFQLSAAMTGWAASSAIWGCIFGVLCTGYISDAIGRKKVLILTAIIFALSAVASAVPANLTQFVIARFINGVAVGAASMLSPLYIAEVAPAKHRGILVTLYQLAIVIGINLIYFINMKIASMGDEAWNVELGWRYMLGSEVVPAIIFFGLLFLVPESPRWLASKNRLDEALNILRRLNGDTQARIVLQDIRNTLHEEKGTVRELFSKGLRAALIVGVVLALFSQITGINAIIYYAPEILKSIGMGQDAALVQTVIIGTTNTIFTFVAIAFIDRIGRRSLLLWGVSGMVICLAAIGLLFYLQVGNNTWLMIFIIGYIASFASSLGPIPWVIISEIFPTKTRGVAMSLATVVLWIGVALITQWTPVMMEDLGGAYTFWIFMVNAVILLVFSYKMIPETKGKTLEEIERIWKKEK